MSKPFAIVTAASSGIGLELAAIYAQEGFNLLIAADRPEIHAAADRFRGLGAQTLMVETDLATIEGVVFMPGATEIASSNGPTCWIPKWVNRRRMIRRTSRASASTP
jgi:NAD(P)-dependent dehydrogenase (short-subunit alcohol dehydrogenase family)